MKNKIILVVLTFLLTASLFVVSQGGVAKAIVTIFGPPNCYTSSATTSPVYLAVTATTTVTCPLGLNGAVSASVTVMVNASSSLTTFSSAAEESMNGIDWFPVSTGQISTTTNPFNVNSKFVAVFPFASSTVGGLPVTSGLAGTNGTNNRNQYTFDVPVRMRYLRVITYGNTTFGSVWQQIIPRQGTNN